MPMQGVAATIGAAMSNTARMAATNFGKRLILNCYFAAGQTSSCVIYITNLMLLLEV
jgi:hypothetical protein